MSRQHRDGFILVRLQVVIEPGFADAESMEAHGTRKVVTADDDREVATSRGEQFAKATCEGYAHRGKCRRIRVLDVVVDVNVIHETLESCEIGEVASAGAARPFDELGKEDAAVSVNHSSRKQVAELRRNVDPMLALQ